MPLQKGAGATCLALTVNNQSSDVGNAQQQRGHDNGHSGIAFVELLLNVDLAGDEIKGEVADQHQHDADQAVAHRIHDTCQQDGHVHNWSLSVQLNAAIDSNELSNAATAAELHFRRMLNNGRQ